MKKNPPPNWASKGFWTRDKIPAEYAPKDVYQLPKPLREAMERCAEYRRLRSLVE